MIVFPYFYFSLKISSTIIAVDESTFAYGESKIKMSASEISVRARAIFYKVDTVNLF